MNNSIRCLIVGLFGLMCSAHIANTDQVISDSFKLLAPDGAANDGFGRSVSISNNVAIVGVDKDDDDGSNSGSAYVFFFDGTEWIMEAKLLASDGAADNRFGREVYIDGDTAVVGARFDDANGEDSGAAYVYVFDGSEWLEQAKLLASDGADGDEFGRALSTSSDRVLIGARLADTINGDETGAAYVFRFTEGTWLENMKLAASDGSQGDRYGHAVAIDGDTIVIGAINSTDSGAAYIYRFNSDANTWGDEVILSEGSAGDQFGCSVSIDGNNIVIGSHTNDINGSNAGSAYIYHYDDILWQWAIEGELFASDGAVDDHFGHSVSVSGDTVIVGAHQGLSGSGPGSAYVFRYDGNEWVEEAKLLPDDGASEDFFGRSVSISGDTAIVGADKDDDFSNNSGSAYVFVGVSGDSDGDGVLDEEDNCDLPNPDQADCNCSLR